MGSRANFNPSWRRTRSARCRTARTVATPGRRRDTDARAAVRARRTEAFPGNDQLPRHQSSATGQAPAGASLEHCQTPTEAYRVAYEDPVQWREGVSARRRCWAPTSHRQGIRLRHLATLFTGILLGAVAWGLAHAVSGTFEPFDSAVGFLTTQVILGTAAFCTGLYRSWGVLVLLVLGAYLGLNVYPYLFGGTESRAWALLGAFTTTTLVVIPAIAGAIGFSVSRVRRWMGNRRSR